MSDRTSSPHYQQLIKAVPPWLGNASPHRRQHLQRAALAIEPWYGSASETDHRTLKALNGAAWAAQNPVDQALAKVLNINDFARPKLQKALKEQFALNVDVEKTLIRLYIPANIPWFPIRSGAARTWTVSLLEAALHNFELDETRTNAHESASCYLQEAPTAGQFEILETVKTRMSIQAFTELCRTLDIGGQYQQYLAEQFLEPVASAVLRRQASAAQNAAFKTAVHMAVMKQDLSISVQRLIEGLMDGLQGMRLDGKTWLAHDLTMMSASLTGIVLFAPDLERHLQTVPVVAYIPDDPEHPVKQYTSSAALMQDLTRKLRGQPYQQFFSRFVAHEDRGYFFADLNQRLSHVTWHQHVATEPLPTWRETPVTRPNLQFAVKKISGGLLPHLYQRKLNQIINDAAVTAVSTASADRRARWQRWDALEKIAKTLLEIAAFVAAPFFPPLGALMLGYTLYQVLDETFESIIDWAEGLTTQALGHFMMLMETLVQLGMFAVGLPIAEDLLRQALPKELWNFIDRLKPVRLPDGQARLWNPDLKPYRQPANARPTGTHPLRLPQGQFSLKPVGDTEVFRFQHPRRANAYQPLAKHNGAGIWSTELDEPLTWSDDLLIQRLGPAVQDVPTQTLKRLCALSEVDANALRKLHVNNEPLPPLLEDQLKRWKIDHDLQRFIDQMNSDEPAVYTRADPQTQLQLLTSYSLWPETKALCFLNAAGEITWRHTPKTRFPVVQIHEAQLARGDLLSIVLQTLNETEVRSLVGEQTGEPPNALSVRTGLLRKKIAQLADAKRASLFDSRYRGLEVTREPRVQALIDTQPGLPTSVARELLRGASSAELKLIDRARVPERLKELARWARQEVRLSRAYEGLYLNSSDTPDTDLLVLHSLEGLRGWSSEVRIEIKNHSFNGELRDSIGQPTAPLRKVLVMDESGEYQVNDHAGRHLYGTTDLYTAILQALPDAQRIALGLNIGEGPRLRQLIGDAPLPRDALRNILVQHPLRKPAYDPKTMRLPGGMHGYRAASGRTLEDRVQQLYPEATQEQVQELVTRLNQQPGGALSALVTLQSEYTRLEHDLATWEANTPKLYPGTEVRVSRQDFADAQQARRRWAQQFKRCWRQETEIDLAYEDDGAGYRLYFDEPVTGALPTLNLRMVHVTFLELRGNASTQGVTAFLQYFPALRHLALHDIPLNTVPPTVFELQGLTELVLAGAGINHVPDSLLHPPKLDIVILSDNQINELPAALFDPDKEIGITFDFSGNPLSRPAVDKVKAHYHRTGEDWSVMAPQADIATTQALYPSFTPEEASAFVMDLPGDLDAGLRALADLQQDYQTLQDDLARWVITQPAEHPIQGGPLDANTAATEQLKREQLKELLERAWRRETDEDPENTGGEATHELMFNHPLLGEYPNLKCYFKHISVIKLECADLTTDVSNFLKSFPKLRELNIRKARLGNIPEAVFRMPHLRLLSLIRCRLRLTDTSARSLTELQNLFWLDLHGNPELTLVPDVSQMTELGLLALSRCSLTEFPPGLLTRTKLELADLRDNLITRLPAAIYEAPRALSNNLYLSGNPFSPEGVEQVVQFATDTGIDLLRPLEVFNLPPLMQEHIED